jgi:hypothetical protein
MNINTKQVNFKNIIIPNEIINIILSYRIINPVSIIFKNEYINSYNKKYIKIIKEINIDLTYGSNRANYFIPVEMNIINDLANNHFQNNNTDNDNNTDNETYTDSESYTDSETYTEPDISLIETNNTELLYNTTNENNVSNVSNEHYDDYENTEEHWALSDRNDTIQLQAINCYVCGEYRFTHNITIPDRILCRCDIF